MKKFLIIILFLGGFFSFSLYAEEGRGSCIIAGTANDYVEVTAYISPDGAGNLTGNLVVVNSSSKPLMSVYIKVIADIASKVGEYVNAHSVRNGATIYECNYIPNNAIAAYSSASIPVSISGYEVISNIQVVVNNPTCK